MVPIARRCTIQASPDRLVPSEPERDVVSNRPQSSGPHARTSPPHPLALVHAQANVVGLSVFAYSYVVTIPSWVNEKRHRVSINKAVWVPATVGLVMKVCPSVRCPSALCFRLGFAFPFPFRFSRLLPRAALHPHYPAHLTRPLF